MLITGGTGEFGVTRTAEIYHPPSPSLPLPPGDSPCVLKTLPEGRHQHTQDGSLVCGGSRSGIELWKKKTPRSCHKWNPDTGAWDLVTEALTEDRVCHTSWTPADGSVTYLMGGRSYKTSGVIDRNNSQVRTAFPLMHENWFDQVTYSTYRLLG